jgi:hypothetical protein
MFEAATGTVNKHPDSRHQRKPIQLHMFKQQQQCLCKPSQLQTDAAPLPLLPINSLQIPAGTHSPAVVIQSCIHSRLQADA